MAPDKWNKQVISHSVRDRGLIWPDYQYIFRGLFKSSLLPTTPRLCLLRIILMEADFWPILEVNYNCPLTLII